MYICFICFFFIAYELCVNDYTLVKHFCHVTVALVLYCEAASPETPCPLLQA